MNRLLPGSTGPGAACWPRPAVASWRALALLAAEPDALAVVADGGSADGTQDIVRALMAAEPRLRLIHNPDRLQSAGINRAVDLLGEGRSHLLRADAHADYPPGFIPALLDEMALTGAASVTVGMETVATNDPSGDGFGAERIWFSTRARGSSSNTEVG